MISRKSNRSKKGPKKSRSPSALKSRCTTLSKPRQKPTATASKKPSTTARARTSLLTQPEKQKPNSPIDTMWQVLSPCVMTSSPVNGPPSGKVEGRQFEAIFEKVARLRGFLPRKMHLTARYIHAGRPLITKSELDYQLIHPTLGVAFIDCKTFQGDRFTFSDLELHQVKTALLLNEWDQKAGFVVWFRAPNKLVFYSGVEIMRAGPGSSFGVLDGAQLGDLTNFRLEKVYITRRGNPSVG